MATLKLITNARTDFAPIAAPVTLPAKRIVRVSADDFDMFYGDAYIGSAPSHAEAERRLNDHAFRVLTHRGGK